MAGSKTAHNGKRAPEQPVAKQAAAPTFEPAPKNVRIVNHTELTNKLVQQACQLTVSPVARMAYLAVGVLIGISAFVFRSLYQLETIAFVLVLAMAIILIFQGMRLPKESARNIIARLNKAGAEYRARTYWTTDVGIHVASAGQSREYPWESVQYYKEQDGVLACVMRRGSELLVLDEDGFVRGSASDFVGLLGEHVQNQERSAIATKCDALMYKLDHWKQLYGKK